MKNIYLVGFMATGKTAVAKILAGRLNLKLVDMDAEIEAREKMPISEIFRLKGEPYFRDLEKGFIKRLARGEGQAVACGGGVFVDPENIGTMKKSGVVICLTSKPETILRRTAADASRPLLNVADPQKKIEELLEKRRPFYAQAHHTIDCDALSVEESAQAVLNILQHERL
ncbi:shikimate kinase I [Candidatus Velamenicoccus archaeovorus]|uniref:Shikimate kinase n=1 Tax=Velamenicoccus archaeovorus TaxID=1930593 RepID=A0A410P2H4_VELA1|nr:shikimate kinase [Candidatus Velamenicoccus archaeovorus]QAT16395.1 shikimate kinase I [Candidatus Velamenicoccus archaeovorus]